MVSEAPWVGSEVIWSLTSDGVREQQRHPTFALTALGGARWAFGGFSLAEALDAVHGRMVAR